MSAHRQWAGSIRKLLPHESPKFRDHLLRLDRDSRRLRFAHAVNDRFITDYALRMSDMGSIVFGFVVDGEVRAVAELRKLSEVWGQDAEAAFSVEADYQNAGIGTELMGRVIRAARNRGVQRLYMSCLAENAKVQAIARRYGAELTFEQGEIVGEIVPDTPNYFSILAEAAEDRISYTMSVLNLQSRLLGRQEDDAA